MKQEIHVGDLVRYKDPQTGNVIPVATVVAMEENKNKEWFGSHTAKIRIPSPSSPLKRKFFHAWVSINDLTKRKRQNPPPSASIKRAERIRAAFQGEGVDSAKPVRKPAPLVLVALGRAVAIEYESDKLNGGGDGTKATYRHEFAPGDVLATDQDGRTLYVLGPRLRVNSRGIVD